MGKFWRQENFGCGKILDAGKFWLQEHFGSGKILVVGKFWLRENFGGKILVWASNCGKVLTGKF